MTTAQTPGGLDPAAREAFQRDGVACLRGLIVPGWIDLLREAVAETMAKPGPYAKNVAAEGGRPGMFYSEIFPSLHNAKLRRFISESRIGEVAAFLMDSREVRYFNDHLLVKEPGTDAPTLWHQDLPYFPCAGTQVCSVWVGLDPVTRDTGAMSFALGSQRWGRQYRAANFGTGQEYEGEALDGSMPDIDADPSAYPTVCYEMEPGDVTFHHANTAHSARGNSSLATRRRGYSVRLTGDDVVWHSPPRIPRGFKVLEEGRRLDDPFYAQLWPQRSFACGGGS